jgi:hypothetical protein
MNHNNTLGVRACEAPSRSELLEALREIEFALRYADENPVTGPVLMMHHPYTVRGFIGQLLLKTASGVEASDKPVTGD